MVDKKIGELRREVEKLRGAGGTLDADPQARLLSLLSGGVIAKRDVPLALVLLLAVMIEFVSAFMPVGLSIYASAHRGARQDVSPTQTDMSTPRPAMARSTRKQSVVVNAREVGSLVDYMTERTEPGSERETLAVEDLHRDYCDWCTSRKRDAYSREEFLAEIDRVRAVHGLADRIGKTDEQYTGIRFVRVAALPSPARATSKRKRA